MTLKSRLMPLYRASPAALQNVIGSVYGAYLNFWRYGPQHEQLVAEAQAREQFSAERWQAWSEERLAAMLQHAANEVPYYREQWRERRRQGDDAPVDRLENWPVLTKEALRSGGQALIADGVRRGSLFTLQTSGTSGTPVTTHRSKEAMQAWYALVEARWRRWYGVTRKDRWAILGGQEVTPLEREAPPFWLWNQAGNQLYLSSLHLKPEHAAAYVRALHDYRIVHMYSYSSSLAQLARMVIDQGLDAPKLKVAVTNAEGLEPYQREVISEAFGCAVHTSYGMSEAVAGASECEHGRLHLWPEAGFVEVLDDDGGRVPAGEAGRLICTGLLNEAMPLIRYDVGDRGALRDDAGRASICECGRALPILERLEGRNIDNLLTSDGRKVFWVNPVLYGQPVHAAQIVQTALDRVVVKVVPAAGFGPQAVAAISEGLKRRLGEVAVEVVTVDAIESAPNGKFRSVVNLVQDAGSTGGVAGEALP